jgi:23S rRNA pseudouridine1911/1915/1917 synthase
MIDQNDDSNDEVPMDADGEDRVRMKIPRRLPGRRLDKYVHGRLPRMSRTMIARLIKQGEITVNGQPTKPSYEPNGGDLIEILVPPPVPINVIPEELPLEIVYEDEYLLAINKQIGIVVHPSGPAQRGTLANGLVHYSNALGNFDDPFRPGIVHRLDKNTSGILLVAKTDEAHWRLSLQFERRTLKKTYLAVVEGRPRFDEDIIEAPILPHPRIKNKFMAGQPGRDTESPAAKTASTQYKIAERFDGYSLMHLFPKTGRTHQLRVHMSCIGHPIVGDLMYGGKRISVHDIAGEGSEEPIFEYQALHAFRIEFDHPITEQRMQLEAPATEGLDKLVKLLREHRKP